MTTQENRTAGASVCIVIACVFAFASLFTACQGTYIDPETSLDVSGIFGYSDDEDKDDDWDEDDDDDSDSGDVYARLKPPNRIKVTGAKETDATSGAPAGSANGFTVTDNGTVKTVTSVEFVIGDPSSINVLVEGTLSSDASKINIKYDGTGPLASHCKAFDVTVRPE